MRIVIETRTPDFMVGKEKKIIKSGDTIFIDLLDVRDKEHNLILACQAVMDLMNENYESH